MWGRITSKCRGRIVSDVRQPIHHVRGYSNEENIFPFGTYVYQDLPWHAGLHVRSLLHLWSTTWPPDPPPPKKKKAIFFGWGRPKIKICRFLNYQFENVLPHKHTYLSDIFSPKNFFHTRTTCEFPRTDFQKIEKIWAKKTRYFRGRISNYFLFFSIYLWYTIKMIESFKLVLFYSRQAILVT